MGYVLSAKTIPFSLAISNAKYGFNIGGGFEKVLIFLKTG